MIERDDKRLVFVPLSEATTARHGLNWCYVDCYWTYDPERGLVFFKSFNNHLSAQCNMDLKITETLRAKLYPWAEIRKVDVVYRRQ